MSPSRTLWIVLGVVPLLALALIGAYLLLGETLEAPKGYLTAEGLAFHSKYLAGSIPLESIRISEARLVNPHTETEYRVTRKDNGIAISEYRVGWFRLPGGQKVFVSLDSNSQALYIPTDADFSLLIDGDTGVELLSEMEKLRAEGIETTGT